MDNHIDRGKHELGQGYEALEECSALGLRAWGIPVMVPLRIKAPMEKVWMQRAKNQAWERLS